MIVSNARPGDALLKRISMMSTTASHVIQAVREPSLSPQTVFGPMMANPGRRM
jgi:hypothetical protein